MHDLPPCGLFSQTLAHLLRLISATPAACVVWQLLQADHVKHLSRMAGRPRWTQPPCKHRATKLEHTAVAMLLHYFVHVVSLHTPCRLIMSNIFTYGWKVKVDPSPMQAALFNDLKTVPLSFCYLQADHVQHLHIRLEGQGGPSFHAGSTARHEQP
jgi:hypothetical protein